MKYGHQGQSGGEENRKTWVKAKKKNSIRELMYQNEYYSK